MSRAPDDELLSLPRITPSTPVHIRNLEKHGLGLTRNEAERAIQKEAISHFVIADQVFLNRNGINEYKSRDDVGVIYVLGFDHYVKIGFTRNLQTRLSTLQTALPVKLNLHFTTVGTMADEREVQRRFAAHRLHGEWFWNCAGIRQWIRKGGRI